MPFRPPFFDEAACALKPVLHNLPGKIVSIDGTVGTGKTTLGRFLAWYFNVTLLESDNFLLKGAGLRYNVDAVSAVIRHRLSKPRPILVEGVVALRLLAEADFKSDFHIHLVSSTESTSEFLAAELAKYRLEYRPSERANLTLSPVHE